MKHKRRYAAAVLAAAAVILAFAGIVAYIREHKAGESYDSLQSIAYREPDSPEENNSSSLPEDEITSDDTESYEPVAIPIDFETLQKKNPDIYAWITIPETSVDYPVVQSPDDNSYYLNHTAGKESKPEGAIFTEDYNTKTFEDPNTVIYGHRMYETDAMFNSLKKYTDRRYFDEHREITVYMPDRILTYRIFAAYLYDDRHLMLSFDFWDTEVFEKYLSDIFSMRSMDAFVDTSMTVTADDKIITLSTCREGAPDKRYLVQAVRTGIER